MKFEQTIFANLWESRDFQFLVSTIMDDPNLIHSNHGFYAEKFRLSGEVVPTNPKGMAGFVAYMSQLERNGMPHMRAPLGDSIPMERGNEAFYTGSIPDFISDAYVEKAPERWDKKKRFEQMGDEYQLLKRYAEEWLQPAIDQHEQALSNMAAQAISTGQVVWNFGAGIYTKLYKADIPAENFLKAGAVVWSDNANCKILDQVRKIYNDIREHLGKEIKLQLEITRNQWLNNWLKNAQVLEVVRYYNSLNNQLLPDVSQLDTDTAMNAIRRYNFGDDLPEIVIVEESQYDKESNQTVHGWNDNIAVMRPLGKAGEIKRTDILDQEIYTQYGSSLISRNYTSIKGGLMLLENSVHNNGNMKEWQSNLMMSAIPVLDKFLYHYIIDTTQTSSTTF